MRIRATRTPLRRNQARPPDALPRTRNTALSKTIVPIHERLIPELPLRAELLSHRRERLLCYVQSLIDIALSMRRRDEPVVHRMEVHARPRACAAKYSRSIEVSRVRFETHVWQRRRSRVSHLESRA